jgi:hypothetical protein
MRIYRLLTVLVAGVLPVGTAVILSCAADPREGDAVTVVSACDPARLDTNPASSQPAVKQYLEAAHGYADMLSKVGNELKDVCNNINTELGLPAGTDSVTACAPISKRVTSVARNSLGGPPGTPPWFKFSAEPSCVLDTNAEATCLATCGAPCDATKCPEGAAEGKCTGECEGTCTKTGKDVPCNGACKGTCANQANVCTGECNGNCSDFIVWGGKCAGPGAGCFGPPPDPIGGPFFGSCEGVCTGSCTTNGQTVMVNGGFPPPPDPDAAVPDPDAGDPDGGMEAAAPEAGPPGDKPGNCPFPGQCAGSCDGAYSGTCFGAGGGGMGGPCIGAFSEARCQGVCTGSCTAGEGSGCAAAAKADPDGGPAVNCTGACTEPAAKTKCDGVCTGKCSVPLTDVRCSKSLACAGQNQECAFACQVKKALSISCTPPASVEVEAVSDTKLYAALKKFGPQLAVALQKISILREVESSIAQRTQANFAQVGAKGEVVRACITEAQGEATKAHTLLQALVASDPTNVTQTAK